MESVVSGVAGLERCADFREAGYRNSMATQAIQRALDEALSLRRARSSYDVQGSPATHPYNVQNEPNLGLSTHNGRAREDRYFRSEVYGREVYGQNQETTKPNVAELLNKSLQRNSIYRLYCRADSSVYHALCVGLSLGRQT